MSEENSRVCGGPTLLRVPVLLGHSLPVSGSLLRATPGGQEPLLQLQKGSVAPYLAKHLSSPTLRGFSFLFFILLCFVVCFERSKQIRACWPSNVCL